MRINTNVASLQAQQSSRNTNNALTSSLEKLSSGNAINKASDDGAGLAIADKLRTQASSLGQAVKNGNSAVAMLQIADKAMDEQSNILDIIKTKLVQAGTATTTSAGLTAIENDIKKLAEQINNIAGQTNYNGTRLLAASSDGSGAATTKTFQMGETSADLIHLDESGSGLVQANLSGIFVSASVTFSSASDFSIGTQADARSFLASIDKGLEALDKMRSVVGSTQNQIESSVRNLDTAVTNIKAAESVIRDVDYAAESANFNKQNIIAQAGTYAISQANAMQQNVSRLLQ